MKKSGKGYCNKSRTEAQYLLTCPLPRRETILGSATRFGRFKSRHRSPRAHHPRRLPSQLAIQPKPSIPASFPARTGTSAISPSDWEFVWDVIPSFCECIRTRVGVGLDVTMEFLASIFLSSVLSFPFLSFSFLFSSYLFHCF